MNAPPVRRYRLVVEGDDYTPLSALSELAQALLRVPPGRSVGDDGIVEWTCRTDEELAARDPSQDRETPA
jgi:hypothetical protein